MKQKNGSADYPTAKGNTRNKSLNEQTGAVDPEKVNASNSVERAEKKARTPRMTMAMRRRRCRINLTNAYMRERGLM